MPQETMTTKKALVVVGSILMLLILSFIIPAKSVGITQKKAPLVLDSFEGMQRLSADKDNNKIPDWKDLAIKSLSTTTLEEVKKTPVDAAAKKRLADPNNLTAAFSKNLYMASAYLKNSGGQLTEAEQANLVASVLEQEKTKIITKTYTIEDIKATKIETDESKRIYGNALGALMKKSENYKLAEGDLKTIKAYATSKNATLLEAFVVKRNNIDTLLTKLTAISVPYSAIPYHILALNKLAAYRTTVDSFAQADTDPVRTAIVVNGYLDVTQSMVNALGSMRNYFIISKITFTPSESGYLLTFADTKK